MHNKSFTVDNQASVVGGRNIADEYFQLKDDYFYENFEVLAVGPIANEISKSFDQFSGMADAAEERLAAAA
jgi:putative cardiolipin synthase